MKKASFTFVFDTGEEANIVRDSLSPEIKHKVPKTDIEIKAVDKTLFLEISSNDTSSLRAAINSYLRWINTAINVKKIV
jgi:tRNA threonylcarbamoyladenosine modification (KEOPS) complex  Pcc1 subunit